ncbi:MAG: flagellar hook assembly protein FlgD [Paracoccaceae bacterium]|nr:flagellar hook assembly protein FlgD [Paracoccaceae bacterium]
MTTVPATSAVTPTATSATSSTAASTSLVNPDFTMFLKMLTTQMQNQDPLNPMQSSDFAVQLATFSSVEQQTKTNDLLTGISSQVGTMGMAQLAGWVGMEARVAAPTAFTGSPITLTPAPETGADATTLIVTNSAGKEVARTSIPVSSTTYQWIGLDNNGGQLPNGNYTFQLENSAKGTVIGTDPVESYSKIVEAQAGTSGPVLVLDSGAQVASTAVTALRAAN